MTGQGTIKSPLISCGSTNILISCPCPLNKYKVCLSCNRKPLVFLSWFVSNFTNILKQLLGFPIQNYTYEKLFLHFTAGNNNFLI